MPEEVPTVEEIRAGLRKARKLREQGDALREKGTAELRQWLPAAKGHPGISMEEAAQIAGVTRTGAWHIAKKSG